MNLQYSQSSCVKCVEICWMQWEVILLAQIYYTFESSLYQKSEIKKKKRERWKVSLFYK